ncbi:ORF6C domain-containing protein [Clostridium senegalense]|uniref:ORF6C domain-containing protein n=1 Tax=Clostridium senegalense TaxID=1465809 RepID=UPI001C10BB97|nr:ORF6C domain-containing protein [Clostridium senegalense]MBU5227828.1 ORF6C domain-containing protein [Clostridium senegalense]
MNQLKVINQGGKLLVDSREVAERIGKRHSDLLESIKGYIKYLENGNFRSHDFFISASYKVDGNNRVYPYYLLSRKGCDMVANKLTGEKGVLFTAEYVLKFEEMENKLKQPTLKLSKELQAIFALDERTVEIDSRVKKLEDTMTIDYSQQEELNSKARVKVVQVLGGKDAPAYKELSKKAFSELWRHYKRVMQVNSYKNTAVKDFEKGQILISNWRPTRELDLMIKGANSQVVLNV